MRKLLIPLLLIAGKSFAQQRFENFAALRAQKGTYASWALVRYGTTAADKMGGVFFWDSTSTSAETRKIIGTWIKGRYIKSEPLTQARGVYTIANLSLGQQTFTIPHGLAVTPVNVQYSFQYSSPLSIGSSWTADGTNIYIKLNAVAVLTNLNVCWTAYID